MQLSQMSRQNLIISHTELFRIMCLSVLIREVIQARAGGLLWSRKAIFRQEIRGRMVMYRLATLTDRP